MEPWGIALGALFVSLVTLGFTYLQTRHSASTSYIAQLERRVENLEEQLTAAIKSNEALRGENYDLLQRLFHATGGRRAVPEG